MEHGNHASDDIDKDETVPRIVAIVVGVALIGIVAGGLMYSGIWSPANPTHTTTTVAKQ